MIIDTNQMMGPLRERAERDGVEITQVHSPTIAGITSMASGQEISPSGAGGEMTSTRPDAMS